MRFLLLYVFLLFSCAAKETRQKRQRAPNQQGATDSSKTGTESLNTSETKNKDTSDAIQELPNKIDNSKIEETEGAEEAAEIEVEPEIQSECIIVREAEQFESQNGYSVINQDGTSGGKIIQVGDSGMVNYNINIPKAGRWYFYIKANAPDSESNGLFLYLNNQLLKSPSDYRLSGVGDIYLQKYAWSWESKFQGHGSGASAVEGPVSFDFNQTGDVVFSIGKRKIERPLLDKFILSMNLIESGYDQIQEKCAGN